MKHHAITDPFPDTVEIRRGRRRTVEVALENGRFVARVPRSAGGPELDALIDRLRTQVWQRLQRESVFDDHGLCERSLEVCRAWFPRIELPPFRVRFSRRQHKRWGSCTYDGRTGRIRISAHLMGHPVWLIDAVLHHEIAHLLVPDHGPHFQELVRRNPDHDRAQGYLEALEHSDRLGEVAPVRLRARLDDRSDDRPPQRGLFEATPD
ncbi:MAG TPA: M48 family metallopeptidase [Candidatus Krumholzibacteria bacterium]|nr:M48 family metallopeptidase [Candidatus Krumholzibacteria bacterium]